jgi:NAD(P)H dehydrogenase (quinone)
MARVLVLYYSSMGPCRNAWRNAVAAGRCRSVDGVEAVTVKRVPELVPDDVAKASGLQDRAGRPDSPIQTNSADYDAIIIGTPTRFGNMAAQMRNFLDQTGGLWAKGALVGKIGSAFVAPPPASTAARKPR